MKSIIAILLERFTYHVCSTAGNLKTCNSNMRLAQDQRDAINHELDCSDHHFEMYSSIHQSPWQDSSSLQRALYHDKATVNLDFMFRIKVLFIYARSRHKQRKIIYHVFQIYLKNATSRYARWHHKVSSAPGCDRNVIEYWRGNNVCNSVVRSNIIVESVNNITHCSSH